MENDDIFQKKRTHLEGIVTLKRASEEGMHLEGIVTLNQAHEDSKYGT